MGLGLLGRGVGDIRFLAEQGARLIVTDLKSKEVLTSSLAQLSNVAKNIEFILGEHRLQDFRNRDFILKAAGVPLDSPYIIEARRHHIPIEMSTALFAAYTPAALVGITGTRGKSTVTHLLYEIFVQYLSEKRKKNGSNDRVFLGGNVRGISTLPLLVETNQSDIAVLELDSWQLQGFAERQLSPQLAVFTTFLPDHLNYYKNDLGAYFADKATIFRYQKPSDICVIGSQVAMNPHFQEYLKTIGRPLASKVIIADQTELPNDWHLQLKGKHNHYNVGVALAAARASGIPDIVSRAAIESFMGVPGRLELLTTVQGVSFYNDTTATTPDATVAALKALQDAGNSIILIMGGADKQLDMDQLISLLPDVVKMLVLLPGSGTARILPQLRELNVPIVEAVSMANALTVAISSSQLGDAILLSPAFASFGLFANEFDRGDQFSRAVLEYIHSHHD